MQIFKPNQLTIGVDLGDRISHHCIRNEAKVILEQELPTTPSRCFSKIPRRVALETGTHSPWISRQLTQLGHEVIVAHARSATDRGEPPERRSAGCSDARTVRQN
jgi:transposase